LGLITGYGIDDNELGAGIFLADRADERDDAGRAPVVH